MEIKKSSILASLALSVIATFASYFYYTEPFTADVRILYRGWPLHWMIESWSYWSPPPYPHSLDFQPLNFIIDFVFWTVVFQLPSTLYLLYRNRKSQIQT